MQTLTPVIDEVKQNQAIRRFHGRGHCFPGFEDLYIDVYPGVVVITLFAEADYLSSLLPALSTEFPEFAVLVQERFKPKSPWYVALGTPPESVFVEEDGLRYLVTLMKNQNVGFFPDMRFGRQLVRELAPGKRVLNLFAYTCSFSVAAQAAGATSIVNMDLSKGALRVGKYNHELNELDCRNVKFLAFDIFKSIGKIKRFGPYDLVIIDPPSFQRGAFDVKKDYAKLVRRLPEFLNDGAEIIACLNAPHLDHQFLKDLFHEYEFCEQRGRPPEFKEANPEKSLKIHLYRYKAALLAQNNAEVAG